MEELDGARGVGCDCWEWGRWLFGRQLAKERDTLAHMPPQTSSEQLSLLPPSPSNRFAPRFLDKYVGRVMVDPIIALIELVANAWDANATVVNITLGFSTFSPTLVIEDDGHGMTAEQLAERYQTFAYQRPEGQSEYAENPSGQTLPKRRVFGRHGKGRLGALCFGDEVQLRTWRDGTEVGVKLSRGTDGHNPLHVEHYVGTPRGGHGTRIEVWGDRPGRLGAEVARTELALRFLANPNFSVTVNGDPVAFTSIPTKFAEQTTLTIPADGDGAPFTLDVRMLVSASSDRAARQTGVAWQVHGRQVGDCSWSWLAGHASIDGRTFGARRVTLIVSADALVEDVNEYWTSFEETPRWEGARKAVAELAESWITKLLREQTQERREMIRQKHARELQNMPSSGREMWGEFIEAVLQKCPTIGSRELEIIASVLAKCELSRTKYNLLELLDREQPEGLDDLNAVLTAWDARSVRIIVEELTERLKLIEKLSEKVRDLKTDEVRELQPLFKQGLWIFGPEYESIQFTSDETITTVLQKLFKMKASPEVSSNRPDFVVGPNGGLSAYSYDHYDEHNGESRGLAKVVIVELKAPRVTIGAKEVNQTDRYVEELVNEGAITLGQTEVTCFILGRTISQFYSAVKETKEHKLKVIPMTYESFLRRAHSRTFGLRAKLQRGLSAAEASAGPLFGGSP
jgi:hypothetical protein